MNNLFIFNIIFTKNTKTKYLKLDFMKNKKKNIFCKKNGLRDINNNKKILINVNINNIWSINIITYIFKFL